ncbi:HEPN domain-containing protein [Breoghania sp.]|uniref:HEPN domain-containing protein n=1 Tax=Breoghania sp. TaxID=2065378 RepID=UPI003748592B
MNSYTEIFDSSDRSIGFLSESVASVSDPLVQNRFIGFLSVTAVTFYEEAFKKILYEFARKKHPVFGYHVKIHYEKLNGRIALRDIRNNHITKFGDKYRNRFDRLLAISENRSLRNGNGSIMTSYGNILTWRHNFVHGGNLPSNATYREAENSYQLGKGIFDCLYEAMKR